MYGLVCIVSHINEVCLTILRYTCALVNLCALQVTHLGMHCQPHEKWFVSHTRLYHIYLVQMYGLVCIVSHIN